MPNLYRKKRGKQIYWAQPVKKYWKTNETIRNPYKDNVEDYFCWKQSTRNYKKTSITSRPYAEGCSWRRHTKMSRKNRRDGGCCDRGLSSRSQNKLNFFRYENIFEIYIQHLTLIKK